MDALMLSQPETVAFGIAMGEKKAKAGWVRQIVLAFWAGAFIAFAAEGSNMAAFNLLARAETYGLGKCLAGTIFPVGLMLVMLTGAELFTGNTLMCMALAEKRITLAAMLRNWLFVYIGNFLGSLFLAHMIVTSGQLASGAGMLGGVTLRIAASKVALDFLPAFYLGLMCNWLVCLAVWFCWSARSQTGKMLGIFFPIWLFITSGFEHSVAQRFGLAHHGHHQAVMVFVVAVIQQFDARTGTERSYYTVYLLQVASLTEVGNAFHNFVHIHYI